VAMTLVVVVVVVVELRVKGVLMQFEMFFFYK